MEGSHTDRPVSPDNNELQQVAPQGVPRRQLQAPLTPLSTATLIPPLASGNASFDDLSTRAPVYDSVSGQTTPAFSSSATCLLPTALGSNSDRIPCPDNTSGERLQPFKTSSGSTFSVLLKQWKWETASCALILAVPTVMVATVLPHGDHPIPQWPFKMSINALLSIYALVFKSAIAYVVTSCVGQLQWAWFSSDSRPLSDAVLFDNAGRGPWGLLAMLWAHRFRQPLAILAAVIMISGLAIDPFIQQLVRPFDCSVPLDHDVATLPCTNRIDSYMGPGDDEQPSALPLHAVGTARFSSDNETPWTCSTGNCTFPEVYSTLGVRSACEDVSIDAVINLTPWYPNAVIGASNITTSLSSGDEGYYWASNYNQLNTTFSPYKDEADVAHMDIWSPLPSAADTFSIRIDIVIGKTSFSEEGRLISTGKNITGCETMEASNNKWACRGYGAASCTLKPCVRTYSARIEAGTLKERLISQSPDMDWGSSWGRKYHGLLDTQCVSTQQAAFLTSRGYELRNTTRWIPFYGDVSAGHLLEQWASNEWSSNLESLLQHKCVYLISPDFINKVGYANAMGAWTRTSAASQLVGTVRALGADANELSESKFNVFVGPELLQYIYDYGRVDFERVRSAFKNISDSITTYLRTHGNASHSEPARGQVQHYATCLGIQWPWITLPAVLAVLTILFLVLVVESTGRLETPVWKASLLPWILGGDLEVGSDNSSLDSEELTKDGVTVARMEDESRQILATLSEGAAPRLHMVHMRDHNLQVVDK